MTFVKVVGGIEIYNFHIQCFVHFYTKFWSFSILNSGSAKCLGPNAAVPRCHARPRAARRACAMAGLGVHATHRPRPHAGRGVPLPHAPRPEVHWSPPDRAHSTDRVVPARCALRTAILLAASAVRVPAEAAVPRPHLHGHALVSVIEPPYLNRAPSPPRTTITVHRAIRAAPGELASPSILQCIQSSLNLPWTQLDLFESLVVQAELLPSPGLSRRGRRRRPSLCARSGSSSAPTSAIPRP
jgi:hypothetical protein